MNIWKIRIREFIRYKDLLKNLTFRDVKLKYRRSILGYLWSVLDPLFTMVVLAVVFSRMFNRQITNFPVYLFTGQLIFNYFRASSSHALNSINNNGAIIKKAYVPKYIFTLSKVLSTLIDLLFNMIALFIIMIFTGCRFTVYNLLFPIALAQLFIFCLGFGMFLAQANVFFKDVQYIYNAVMMAWMYLTPIFYPIESLPDSVRFAITRFNPIYFYVKQFRDILYAGTLPQWEYVLAGSCVAVLMLLVGVYSFLKKQDKFILYI